MRIESITQVEIGDWLKTEGDHVETDDPVVVLETEKVTVELPAPAAGVIMRQLKRKGDKAEVGEVIGIMEEGRNAPLPPPRPRAVVARSPLSPSRPPPRPPLRPFAVVAPPR